MTEYQNRTSPAHSGCRTDTERFIKNPLIEEIISKLAQEEAGKRQYYRPVYSIHKWWARRPGTLFRAIILLAACPRYRGSLFHLQANHSLSNSSPFFQDHDLHHLTILDPFMGGGTTLVEANRMGAKVIGSDINPVSYWITRETLKTIDIEKLRAYFCELKDTAGVQIQSLYRTRCVHCSHQADTMHVFWVRAIPCLQCHRQIHLFKRTLLNEGASRNRPVSHSNPATAFCPYCLTLSIWNGRDEILCSQCRLTFQPDIATYSDGYYTCPHCSSEKLSLLQTIRAGERLRETLVAIEYWCKRCRERLYKSPDEDDLQLLRHAENEYEQRKESLLIPYQRIPEGSSSRRWRQHGYEYYRDVFNPRQLLAFNLLFEAIRQIDEPEYRNAFITIFSNSLEYNNMMTPYNFPHRKLHHLFNYHALPLTTTPVENVVWGAFEEGAGTFFNCYHRYERAKVYCERPYDKYKDGKGVIHTSFAQSEYIAAEPVSDFKQLSLTQRGALLLCGDSAHMPSIPSQSVDLVVTDPPYYDNIHYSELSNFFYVWLSLLVENTHFKNSLVQSEKEAIVNPGMGKDESEYQELLTSVFRECHRVLKDEGQLIFTFHHTKWRAWWTIYESIWQSGFRLIDFFPVKTEYKVNPHIRNKQSLDMDMVLICQKQAQPFTILSNSLEDALKRALNALNEACPPELNRLFLHFVGELLRSASCADDILQPSYEWFEQALKYFDALAGKYQHTSLPESGLDHAQLRLFEKQEAYEKEQHPASRNRV